MTTKQKNLIIKNLEEVIGVKTGSSIKGKGIEIFESTRNFDKSWSTGLKDGTFLNRLNDKIAKDPIVIDRLFIKEFYRQDPAPSRYLKSHEMPSVADILDGEALKYCTEISISIKGVKLYGYIAISKYDTKDITSMHQLVKDVNTLMGHETSAQVMDSSYDEFDEDITFKGEGECATGGYHSKYSDYAHVHGGLSAMNPDWSSVEKVDGRLSNHNDGVVDDFWSINLECGQSSLKELDPNGNIAVYHRKGKDWYIGYTLHTEEYELYCLDESGEEEREYALFQYYKEDKELHSTIVKTLKGLVKDCEVKGYIYNELRERNIYNSNDSVWNDNDDVFNLDLIDAVFDSERTEFTYVILDFVNFDEVTDDWRSPARAVKRAYDKWLEKNIVGKADDGRFEEFKTLATDSGYALTQTPIPETDYVQNCVAYKNEEYHFFLGELYGADSASVFFRKIQAALAKRLIEKLEHTTLIQKSISVFVGFNDSIESGNCKSGTEEFCHRHHIDTSSIGGVRGDEVLKMEFTNFTRRAVMQAIVKHGGVAC